MEQIGGLTRLLCTVSIISALSEVLLAGRRGADTVSLLLALSGVGAILSLLAEVCL